jgi:hypothetical protein
VGVFDDIEDEVPTQVPAQGGWNASTVPTQPEKTDNRGMPEGAPSPAMFARAPATPPQGGVLQSAYDSVSPYIPNYLKDSASSLYEGPRNSLENFRRDAGTPTLQGVSGAASTALSMPLRSVTGGNVGFGDVVDAAGNFVSNPGRWAYSAATGTPYEPWGNRAKQLYDANEQRFVTENEGIVRPAFAAMEASLSHPYGFGGGFDQAANMPKKASTPEELAAFHQKVAETAPERAPNPFNENVRAADAIHNQGRLIEDQTGRAPEGARPAVPPEKPSPTGNLFDDIPDVAPVKAAPEAKLEVPSEKPAPAGDTFSDIPDEVPVKSAPEAQGLPQAPVMEQAPNVAGERIFKPQEPPVAPQGQMYAIAGEGQNSRDLGHNLDIRPTDTSRLHDMAQATFDTPYTIEKVVPVAIADISGSSYHPTKIGSLAQKIKSSGWIEPIAIDGEGNVIEGQHRLRAMQELGADTIPAYRIRELMPRDMFNKVADAANVAGVHIEQARQIAGQIAEIIDSEGSSWRNEIDYYEAPKGFEVPWRKAVDAAKDAFSGEKQAYAISGNRQFRGTFPEGQEAEHYAMKLTDAEPFIFNAVDRAGRLDKVAADLESGNVTDKTRMTLGFATQDVDLLAKKLDLDGGKQSAPVEIALQDAKQAREALQSAYDARDTEAFQSASQALKSALGEAARARVEVQRQRSEPAAFDYWMENHLPEGVKAALASDPAYAITAYHGGPHDFDRFDSSKIGTGEGAQAYGFGLYFAQSEGVAKSYQTGLAAATVRLGGHTFEWGKGGRGGNEADIAKALKLTDPMQIDTAAEIVGDAVRNGRTPLEAIDEIARDGTAFGQRALELKPKFESLKFSSNRPSGRLYTVSLDVEPHELLDWDKPLSEQPEKVRTAVKSAARELRVPEPEKLPSPREYDEIYDEMERILPKPFNTPHYATVALRDADVFDAAGAIRELAPEKMDAFNELSQRYADLHSPDRVPASEWYSFMQRKAGQLEVSKALHEAGIPGIKYLDQGSHTAGEGSHNFVIFDDSKVKITAKDGKPVSGEERADVLDQSQDNYAVLGDSEARTDTVRQLAAGHEVRISPRVVSAIRQAHSEIAQAVPHGVRLGAVTKIEKTSDPETFKATFITPDGSTFTSRIDRDTIWNGRAVFVPGSHTIQSLRFGGFGKNSLSDFAQTVRGEAYHEIAHSLLVEGSQLPLQVRSDLIAHANSLNVLGLTHKQYLRMCGDPSANSASDLPLKTLYEKGVYKKRFDEYRDLARRARRAQEFDVANAAMSRIQADMDSEAVAHMVELAAHGKLTPKQLGPVAGHVQGIMDGRWAGKQGSAPSGQRRLNAVGPKFASGGAVRKPPIKDTSHLGVPSARAAMLAKMH